MAREWAACGSLYTKRKGSNHNLRLPPLSELISNALPGPNVRDERAL
jgi:hypothetical protein